MNYNIADNNGIKIFYFNEIKLDTSCSGLLKAELTSLISNGDFRDLIVDLSKIEICDSSGLSVLLVANRLISAKEGNLVFVTGSPKMIQLIQITRLNKVLTIAGSVEEAILLIKEK
ncbi:MAG: STAS domain-containing protein [Ignavibacteriales bacterium]|jgi:anti-sigma B factor antagonist|nr:STAS domain-containing protein [Ignavibacteriaceae bacterium]NLH60912.1 STAS domain-containing protein [Ignavibacteriales bacterium]HOJ18924.1 STAS domain-containing protein [Ignavibacteriaceae bacterium]HPO55786.1 STAS domain-containing protein [Ignavibacteriaceae bacterium]